MSAKMIDELERLKRELTATREAFFKFAKDVFENTPNPEGVERPDPESLVESLIAFKAGRYKSAQEVLDELRTY